MPAAYPQWRYNTSKSALHFKLATRRPQGHSLFVGLSRVPTLWSADWPQTNALHSSWAPSRGSQTERTLLSFHLSSLLRMSPLALLQQVSATLKITKFNYSDSQSFIMRVRVDDYICDPGAVLRLHPCMPHAALSLTGAPQPSACLPVNASWWSLPLSALARGLEGWWLGRLVKAAEVGG